MTSWSRPLVASTGRWGWGSRQFTCGRTGLLGVWGSCWKPRDPCRGSLEVERPHTSWAPPSPPLMAARGQLGTGQVPCWPHTRPCGPDDLPHSRPHGPAGRSGFHQVAHTCNRRGQPRLPLGRQSENNDSQLVLFTRTGGAQAGGGRTGPCGEWQHVHICVEPCTPQRTASAARLDSTVGWAVVGGGTPGQVSLVSRGPEPERASAQATAAAEGPRVPESAAFLAGRGAAASHGRSVHIQPPAFLAPPQRRKRCGLGLTHRPAAAPRPHPAPASPARAGPARTAERSRSLRPPCSSTAQTHAQEDGSHVRAHEGRTSRSHPHRPLTARSRPVLPGRVELAPASRARAVLDRDVTRKHVTPELRYPPLGKPAPSPQPRSAGTSR